MPANNQEKCGYCDCRRPKNHKGMHWRPNDIRNHNLDKIRNIIKRLVLDNKL